MATIRDIRKRIRSVTNTKKVTHAMELVAAAKMRKSQMAALASRPYEITLKEVLAEIEKNPQVSHPLLKKNDAETELIIMVTSDRGLVGGLNVNLFREALKVDIKNVKFLTVGTKAKNFAAKFGKEIIASFGSEEIPFLELARTLSKMALLSYLNKEVGKVSVIYPKFESTVSQVPTMVQVLPINLHKAVEQETKIQTAPENILFEPNLKRILTSILPHHLLTTIYQILLDAKASEHSAQMIAMKNATDAANDLIDDLTLTYNQARQEAITKELLDIVTAQRAFQ